MKAMHQVIFINGPRRSGKDTAAKHIISEWLQVHHMKFAAPMKHSLRHFFGMSDALWKQLEETDSGKLKLEKLPTFLGMSWVDALIWYSEEVMKPEFGEDVFGQLAVRDLVKRHPAPLSVFSDSRFAVEALPVIKQYGADNCHVFQLFREGFTFEGDSGSYFHPTALPNGVTFWQIENQYEPAMYRRQILIRTNKVLGGERTYD